jgi:hypothetical protein
MRVRWFAGMLALFTLSGCGSWATGQGQPQYAPYSHDSGSDMHGGDGGGGGEM